MGFSLIDIRIYFFSLSFILLSFPKIHPSETHQSQYRGRLMMEIEYANTQDGENFVFNLFNHIPFENTRVTRAKTRKVFIFFITIRIIFRIARRVYCNNIHY